MTKLLEWLSCATVIFSIWFATITSSSTFVKEWHEIILFLPIICLFLFGLYAATVVLYRVFTFNTCDSAAIELQQVSLSCIYKKIYLYFSSVNISLLSLSFSANRGSYKGSSEQRCNIIKRGFNLKLV